MKDINKSDIVQKITVFVIIGLISFVGTYYLKPIFIDEEIAYERNELIFPLNPIVNLNSKIFLTTSQKDLLIGQDIDIEVNEIFFQNNAKAIKNTNPQCWIIELNNNNELAKVFSKGINKIKILNDKIKAETTIFVSDENDNVTSNSEVDIKVREPISISTFEKVSDFFITEFQEISNEISFEYRQTNIICSVLAQEYLIKEGSSLWAKFMNSFVKEDVNDSPYELLIFNLYLKNNEFVDLGVSEK